LRKKCETASEWIAIGRIKNITHRPEGYPLHKDFASFTLVIEAWEKGKNKTLKELHFTVGWCIMINNCRKTPTAFFDSMGLSTNQEIINLPNIDIYI